MSINTAGKGAPLAVIRGSRRRGQDGKAFHISDRAEDGVPEITIHDGHMQMVPPEEGRIVVFASGASGSGKSVWVANMLAEWRDKHPDGDIIVFSRLAEDPTLDELDVRRVMIDESLVESPLVSDDFEPGSFLVFDDVDSIPSKAVQNAVYATLCDVLNTGRHRGLNVAVTSHIACDGVKTRPILNEAHVYVVFPHGSSAHQIKYLMQRYVGLSNDQVRDLLKLPSRWVAVRRSYPPAVIYTGGAHLVAHK